MINKSGSKTCWTMVSFSVFRYPLSGLRWRCLGDKKTGPVQSSNKGSWSSSRLVVSHVLRTVQLLVLPGFLMIGPLLQREESVWDCCSIAIGSYVFVCSTKSPVVVEICWNHRAPKWRSWRKRTLLQGYVKLFQLVGRILSSLPGMIPVDATIQLEVLKREPPRNWWSTAILLLQLLRGQQNVW